MKPFRPSCSVRFLAHAFRSPCRFALALMLAWLVACAHQTQKPVEVIKSESDPREYRYLTLDNGLQVMLVQANDREMTGVSLAVGVGSYHNPKAFPGLAHYLEHMLFLGTEDYPEPNALQNFLKDNGGFSNAYTATDHTNYFYSVPNEKLEPSLDRFSGYFISPLFDRDYSDKERNAVHHEWSMGKNQDPRILFQLMGLTANPDHPAAQLSVGNRETLPAGPDSGLHDAMRAFYDRYYRPELMNLTLVSEQSLDEQEALVRRHFGELSEREGKEPELDKPGLPPAYQGRHIHYRPQSDKRELIIEFAVQDNTDQWRQQPNQYLSNILSSEEPGTLGHWLREQGWINDMGAGIQSDFYGPDGFVRIDLDMTREGMAQRDKVIAATFAYIDRVRDEGVTQAYYDEYRTLAQRRFADQQPPRPVQQAAHTSSKLFHYPPAYVNAAQAEFAPFDSAPIRAVLEQLQPEKARIWHISEQEPVDTEIPHYKGRYSVTPVTDEQLANWRDLASGIELSLPPKNEFAGASGEFESISQDVQTMTQLVEEPGLDVWFRHAEHHQNGKGYLHFVWNTDLGITDAEHYVMQCLINGLLGEKNTALIDRAQRAGLSVNFDRSATNMQTLTLHGPSERHPELASQLLDSVGSLSFDQSDMDHQRERFRQWISSRPETAPFRQTLRWANESLHGFGFDDQELLEANESITLEQLQDYHRRFKAQSTLRLYAFGHYRPEQVERLARHGEKALGETREPGSIHVKKSIDLEVKEKRSIEREVDHSDVAWLRLWLPVGVEEPGPEFASMILLGELTRQPMYNQLRTEEQWGYVVHAGANWMVDRPTLMAVVQSSDRALPEIEPRVETFLEQHTAEIEAVAPEKFEQLKASIIAQRRQEPNDFVTEARRYQGDFYRNDGDFDTYGKTTDNIEATTLEQVRANYHRWLIEGENTAVMTFQAKGSGFADTDFAPGE